MDSILSVVDIAYATNFAEVSDLKEKAILIDCAVNAGFVYMHRSARRGEKRASVYVPREVRREVIERFVDMGYDVLSTDRILTENNRIVVIFGEE